MRNSLYIIILLSVLFSCETQKPVAAAAKPKPIPVNSTPPKAEKHSVQHYSYGDFFRINIADPGKNNNTISHGSIVSAEPKQYKVVKTFFPAVAQNFRQRYIIVHYTALDHDKSVSVLTQQAVSSHYLVNDTSDSEIYQLVDENKRAYHAGISNWRKDQMLNDTSIGIEIVNAGFVTDASGKRQFFQYTEHQFKKIAALIKDIATRYDIPPTNILGHSDIAPTRKQDPGPYFPWKRLYDEYQIGMWYDNAAKQNFYNAALEQNFDSQYNNSSFVTKVQTMFNTFGYALDVSGTWDDATKKTIEAFQYHFRPEKYDGILDAETYAILQALIQKYPSK